MVIGYLIMTAKTHWMPLNWQDPFELNAQLMEEQRMVRDSAQQFAQGSPAPRVQNAFRHEQTDASLFAEMTVNWR